MPLRGLTIGSDRTLQRDGQRFRNIGLNYGGAITRIYSQPSTTACAYTPSAEQDAMLAIAVSMKVKVLRVKATPFWPAQWRYGVNGGVAGVAATAGDREAHYQELDSFIAKCRGLDIGVVLTLFFRHASPCDLAGQTLRAGWLSGGATRTFAQAVTQEIVTRYLNEDAVYGYEWSNEVNHYNDASDATRGGYPAVNPSYGSPSSYSAANDMFVGRELADVLAWWTGIVTAIDPDRVVMSGNGPNSYSLAGGAAGIATPQAAWHREQVRDNPMNTGSIHLYWNIGYGSAGGRGMESLLAGARYWQQQAGRGFVLGEFGNQPWQIGSISTAGGVATLRVAASFPAEVGDRIGVCGTGTALDGQWLTIGTINASRSTITAPTGISASYLAGRLTGSWTAQPYPMLSISGNGTTATINVVPGCPAAVSDQVTIAGTGTAWDGQTLTVAAVNGAQDRLTASSAITASWKAVNGLKSIDGTKLARMCDDIINSGTDVALWWMLDGDTGRPVGESIDEPGNAGIRAAILAANTRLGW